MDEKTRIFEENRRVLESLAYRMLGTLADARDIVQDTYLKWREADHREIRDARAWLVTVCSRLALNSLRSARARRETYVGTWLPEPLLEGQDPPAADSWEIDDTVSVALMLALERLSPSERAAFLLHEVFGHGFDEIAVILGKSSAACRQLASRARAHVQAEKPRFDPSAAEHQRLLEAFLRAARAGELAPLKTMLAASVEMHSDGGGKADAALWVLRGPETVATFLVGVWRKMAAAGIAIQIVPRWFNGAPGLLVHENGTLATALSVSIADGTIQRIYAHRNPEKLSAFQSLGERSQ